MKFTEVDDPEVATRHSPMSYLGLPGPQFLQIFRTSFASNVRMTRGEAFTLAHEALERHVLAINVCLEKSIGMCGFYPPYEYDEQTVCEGSEPIGRLPIRMMHGALSFHGYGCNPQGEAGILALRGRQLILGGTHPLYTAFGPSEFAREEYWLSELALGFSGDGRRYYRGFHGFEMDALLNWDLSEFNG